MIVIGCGIDMMARLSQLQNSSAIALDVSNQILGTKSQLIEIEILQEGTRY